MRRTLHIGAVLGVLLGAAGADATVVPERLRCESATSPLGIDAPSPRLSWIVTSDERAQVQTAFQVLAASREELLHEGRGDLWDSGRVDSSETLGIPYAGQALASGHRVWWTVRVWDRDDRPSEYARPTWFEMGLLRPDDWTGQWVSRNEPERTIEELERMVADSGHGAPGTQPATSSGPQRSPRDRAQELRERAMYLDNPAPLLRKEFLTSKRMRRARAYVSGLGYYELRLNGRKVGDHVLEPGWTTYAKRVFYSTYDVTPLLRNGRNAIGIMLGNGWYNPLPLRMWGHINPREHLTVGRPRAVLQLNIEYEDGSRESIVTDASWKASGGPILRNSVYLGEVYDARREQAGWDEPGFVDESWEDVVPAKESLGPLRAQSCPPIRRTTIIHPLKVTEPSPGVFIFDMGQNFGGWVTLRVRADAGTAIKLRYGELLYPDGTLNVMTSVCGQIKAPGVGGPGAPDVAYQSETYICDGRGLETYTPRFTFHGFRYVEVTGYPGRPPLSAIEGHRLNADVETAGTFACSNESFNRIQEMVCWTLLSNLFSVQSDCPHREKFGYGGDILATSDMAMLNFDMERFYRKAVEDLADAARENGGITETAPFVGIADDGFGGGSGPIGWGTAHPMLAWQLYRYYGDRRILQEQYETGVRWLALLESKAKDNTIDVGISDHESLVPKPVKLTGTAFYWYNAHLLARIARVLGKNDDAKRYSDLAGRIRDAFNAAFLKEGGRYDAGTQACQAFALHFGLTPEQHRASVLRVLLDDVAAHDGHLTTGIFGTKYMLRALTDAGRADVAYTIANQKTFPGWGHMLEGGATTLWEHWEFSDNTFSHNHPMFGSVSEWFFRALAGINPAEDAVGFNKVVIRPQAVGGLDWARAAYESSRGRIAVDWRRQGDRLLLNVTIPANTTALVQLPISPGATLTEGGRPLAEVDNIKVTTREAGAQLQLGSGTYRFECELPTTRPSK